MTEEPRQAMSVTDRRQGTDGSGPARLVDTAWCQQADQDNASNGLAWQDVQTIEQPRLCLPGIELAVQHMRTGRRR